MSAPWQWVSFADGDLPVGSQFLGVAIIRAHDVIEAARVAHVLGISPGGQVMALPVPEELGPPPAEWDHKLIRDKQRIDALTLAWHGCECDELDALADKATP